MMIVMCGNDSDDRGTEMMAITMAVMFVTTGGGGDDHRGDGGGDVVMMEKPALVMTEDT